MGGGLDTGMSAFAGGDYGEGHVVFIFIGEGVDGSSRSWGSQVGGRGSAGIGGIARGALWEDIGFNNRGDIFGGLHRRGKKLKRDR